MIYPRTFGGNPPTGSRDIVDTRICHADANTDAKTYGIRTETNMAVDGAVGRGHNVARIKNVDKNVNRVLNPFLYFHGH